MKNDFSHAGIQNNGVDTIMNMSYYSKDVQVHSQTERQVVFFVVIHKSTVQIDHL